MNQSHAEKLLRMLARGLRHPMAHAGLQVDSGGWAAVEAVVRLVNQYRADVGLYLNEDPCATGASPHPRKDSSSRLPSTTCVTAIGGT